SVATGGAPVNITHISVLDVADDVQGGTIDMANFPLDPLHTDYTLLGGGTAKAGSQLLQLLGADGCTETQLDSDLIINNGSNNFTVTMQDIAVNSPFPVRLISVSAASLGEDSGLGPEDFSTTGHNITIECGPNINVNNHLTVFVSDGASPP